MPIQLKGSVLIMLKQNFLLNKIIICCILSVFILLCGCVREQNEIGRQDTVTFTDALGRNVTVEKNPARVAALLGSFADVWTLAGGELCAAAQDAWDDFGLSLPDVVSLGGAHSPNAELLLSASPDFVLASASTAADLEMLPLLEKSGIAVAFFDVDCFDDYLAMLTVCTEITDRPDLLQQNGTAIKVKIDELKQEFSAADVDAAEKKILLLRVSSSFVKAKGSDGTVLGEMLADIGCVNIADSEKSLLENLSIEVILREEPQHVFIVTMGDDTRKASEQVSRLLKDNPAWGALEAVRLNRVHFMEKELFNLKPNEKWALAYETLIDIFCEK